MTADLVGDAQRLANRTHRLAESCGDGALGRALQWEARRWRETATVVVVAGETRRGKTSVLNALLQRPALLPSGVGATSAQVVVRHGSPEVVRVTRRHSDETVRTETVDPARLATLVTDEGPSEQREGLVAVEVVVDSPLLEATTFLDTPGIGSMTPGHREAALTTAGSADLLVLVVSADEPLLRSELDFLLDASERVGSLVFVLNRTDLNPDWEDMRREHRDRMQRATADLEPARREVLLRAPILPVSARLALKALESTPAAEALWRRSGIEQLHNLLADLSARQQELRARNVVRLADSAARRLEESQVQVLEAAQAQYRAGHPSLDADLAALRADLNASARWRRELRVGSQRLQTGVGAEVARRVDALENEYRSHIAGLSVAEATALAAKLPEDLERSLGAICAQLTEWLSERASAEFAELHAQLGPATVNALTIDEALLATTAPRPRPEEDALTRTAETGLPLVTQSWAVGHLAGTVLGVAAVGWVVIPIGVALVAPLAVLRHRRRSLTQSRQELERAVRETLATCRRELSTELAMRLVDLRADLESRLEDALQERKEQLEQRRGELDLLEHQHTEEKNRVARDAQLNIERAREIRKAAEELRTRLSALDVSR